MIVFADKSVVYTRPSTTMTVGRTRRPSERLPYYLPEDLELLSKIGMAREEIDLFVKELDATERTRERSPIDQYDHIIQRIIDATDVPTRVR